MAQRTDNRFNILAQKPSPVPTGAGYAEQERAKAQASNDNNWQKMLQAAAMASMMDNRTALGFGLGSLLANNWDKWFGGKGKKSDSQGSGNTQYDFSLNMATAQDPLKFAAAGGDPHAQWALENNKTFSLMNIPQQPATISAAPMPNNLMVDGVNPQAPATGNTIQAGIPLTQQLTIGGQNAGNIDPSKAMMDSNMNPANGNNFFVSAMNNPPNLVADAQNAATGGLGAFSAPTFDASTLSGAADAVNGAADAAKGLNLEDWWKNMFGGGK